MSKAIEKLAKDVAKVTHEFRMYRVQQILKKLNTMKNKTRHVSELEKKLVDKLALLEVISIKQQIDDLVEQFEDIL